MKHNTINKYISEVIGGTMSAHEAATDMHPNMDYAVEYYSPARGEWDAYHSIRSEYKKLKQAPKPQAVREVEFVSCSCGHSVSRNLVM